MNTEIANPPSVLWAQRSGRVLLTFNVECDKPDIKFDKKSVSFQGICSPHQKEHAVKIPLYDEIDPEKSSFTNKQRHIEVILAKQNPDAPYWPSLTSDKKKHHWLKVDFDRWQEEDESADELDDFNDLSFAEEDDLADLQ